MTDLISRQAVTKFLNDWLSCLFENCHKQSASDLKMIIKDFKNLPSAQPDVPESCVGNMISRQAAIDTVRSYYDECDEREESIEERIERLPSADIDLSGFSDKLWAEAYERGKAEVVRCKDCKHQVKEWRTDKRLKNKGYMVCGCEVVGDSCGYWALLGQDDDYCSRAERRTDA